MKFVLLLASLFTSYSYADTAVCDRNYPEKEESIHLQTVTAHYKHKDATVHIDFDYANYYHVAVETFRSDTNSGRTQSNRIAYKRCLAFVELVKRHEKAKRNKQKTNSIHFPAAAIDFNKYDTLEDGAEVSITEVSLYTPEKVKLDLTEELDKIAKELRLELPTYIGKRTGKYVNDTRVHGDYTAKCKRTQDSPANGSKSTHNRVFITQGNSNEPYEVDFNYNSKWNSLVSALTENGDSMNRNDRMNNYRCRALTVLVKEIRENKEKEKFILKLPGILPGERMSAVEILLIDPQTKNYLDFEAKLDEIVEELKEKDEKAKR